MAIQFPNFLSAPQAQPDYSGIGDIVSNYYTGRGMPKADLIQQIQAQFARPNAETNLENAKLTGAKTKMDTAHVALQIQQLRQQLGEQAKMEAAIRTALAQGGAQPGMPSPNAMRGALGGGQGTMPMPQLGADGTTNAGIDPTKIEPRYRKFDQVETGLPREAYQRGGMTPINDQMAHLAPLLAQLMQPKQQAQPAPMPSALAPAGEPIKLNGVAPEQTPAMLAAQPSAADETIINKGSPNLYGIDQLWDTNPQARALLEKKGFKKTVKTDIDKKTGVTRELTTNPSGKTVLRKISPEAIADDAANGIPLTKPILDAAVKQVRGTDAVIPYIDEMLAMGGVSLDKNGELVKDKAGKILIKNNQLPSSSFRPFTYTDAHAGYQRIVNNALEKYMAASGFQQTDKSTQKIEEIMNRSTGEGNEHYLTELAKERRNMLQGRKSNVEMITKGLKKYPDFGSESTSRYSDLENHENSGESNG